ncbi:MAG: hypothetical protein ACLPX7_23050 [Xanthobacteraceae bacterium]
MAKGRIYTQQFYGDLFGTTRRPRPKQRADQDANISKPQDLAKLGTFGGLRSVAKPAFQRLTDEIAQVQRRWLLVADIFHKIVDLAYDDRIDLRGGPSISKAIELCEIEYTMPGHSQLRNAWTDFRDVAHLIAASASSRMKL